MRRFEPFRAGSAGLSLDEVLARLEARPEVVAVVGLGSTAREVAPWSDYDLLVVTADGPDFDVEFSWIDARPADVVFVSRSAIERLARDGAASQRDADVLRWLAAGRVVFSRSPELEAAREAALRAGDGAGSEGAGLFFRWVEANFTLVKARRWLSAREESYRVALELLLLAGLARMLEDHLRCRGHAWEGEKSAAERVGREDPAFLVELRATLAETSLEEKVRRYGALVERAFEPVGRLWGPGETAGGWLRAEGEPHRQSRWEALLRP